PRAPFPNQGRRPAYGSATGRGFLTAEVSSEGERTVIDDDMKGSDDLTLLFSFCSLWNAHEREVPNVQGNSPDSG
ncbi:hypothetical protein, partial [Mesorhizobium sp.]